MKSLFQFWLFLFVLIAFTVVFCASWAVQTYLAEESAKVLLSTNVDQARRQVEQRRIHVATIKKVADSVALAKARALADLIAADPSLVEDVNKNKFFALAKRLDVDELHVSDEKGVLIASYPARYKGFDMSKMRQSAPFMQAIDDPDFELVQSLQPNGAEYILMQYAGVARKDRKGIVQIGFSVDRVKEVEAFMDIQSIADVLHIGQKGHFRIEPNTADLISDVAYEDEVDGVESLCFASPSVCGNYVIIGSLPWDEIYAIRNNGVKVFVMANAGVFGIVFLLVSVLLQRIVVKGIKSVNSSLTIIEGGNLDEVVSVKTAPEFVALSDGINKMVEALKNSIRKEKKRMNSELELGRAIQASVLPVPLTGHRSFELAAGMFAAKEVGGDFYDFFMIDSDHLALTIADVSGKGVPAALFMMSSKALIKDLVLSGRTPEAAIEKANRELCKNNASNMFLTAFLMVLDLRNGSAVCVNAGHNPPLIHHGKNDEWEYLKIKHSAALGVAAKVKYVGVPVQFEPGDRFMMYTDGVTEAKNDENALFGEKRLKCLVESIDDTPGETVNLIRQELSEFAGDTPQSDDITLLILDFNGRSVSAVPPVEEKKTDA